MRNSKIIGIVLVVLIILNCILYFIIVSGISCVLKDTKYIKEKIEIINNNIVDKNISYNSDDELQDVMYLLMKHKVEHPNIVLRQIILESGHFTSDLYYNNNNILGMRLAKSRPTTAISEDENKYAKYKSIEDCIRDYKIWQAYYASNKTKEDYYKILSKLYAEDEDYVNKLKNINFR